MANYMAPLSTAGYLASRKIIVQDFLKLMTDKDLDPKAAEHASQRYRRRLPVHTSAARCGGMRGPGSVVGKLVDFKWFSKSINNR
jgi:hypothetical protein